MQPQYDMFLSCEVNWENFFYIFAIWNDQVAD